MNNPLKTAQRVARSAVRYHNAHRWDKAMLALKTWRTK